MLDYKDSYSQYLINQHTEAIFLNKDLEVIYLHGDFENILHLPLAASTLNIENMLPSKEGMFFADAIQKVLQAGETQFFENIIFTKNDKKVIANLTFKKVNLPKQEHNEIVVVVFDLLEEEKDIPKEKNTTEGNTLLDHVSRLEKELKFYKNKINKLESIGHTQVEQLHSGNQELVSTNEELQTTNEELQSLNEELHTVNAELQLKNRELTINKNDIQNLFNSIDIGIIFLDKKLKIRKFTPTVLNQFDLVESDINRPITTFSSNLKDVNVEPLCKKVIEDNEPLKQLVTDNDGQVYLMRISPYRTQSEEIEGVMITFVDLSKTKSLLQEFDKSIVEAAQKFDAIYKNVQHTILLVQKDGTINSANHELGDIELEQLVGANFFDLLPKNQLKTFKKFFDDTFNNFEFNIAPLELAKKGAENHNYLIDFIPIPDFKDDKKVGQVFLVVQEKTEEMNYIKSLEVVKNTYTSFMDNAQHQMFLLNEKGVIVYLNSILYSDMSISDVIGQKVFKFLSDTEAAKYRKMIDAIFAGQPFYNISFTYVPPGKEAKNLNFVGSPVIVGEEVAYVAVVGDPL